MRHSGGALANTLMISDFLDELFGEIEGYVYSPYKAVGSPRAAWMQQFYEWPIHKEKLVQHIQNNSSRDVYLSPCLFTKAIVHPNTFKGTRYLWTEFDGNTPKEVSIPPTIRIQSSREGYEHWYWKLDNFTEDVELIQGYTKRLAYHLNADLSVWDYAVVLRPPETHNHKRNRSVILLESNTNEYPLRSFDALPPVADKTDIKVDYGELPTLDSLMAKYTWSDDAWDLAKKSLEDLGSQNGRRDRSAALCRLAFHCIDMGMSNEEIYVVIEDADTRWKKFVERTDRKRRLLGLISYVRSQRATVAELVDESVVYRFKDFLNTSIKLDWIITGLLPVAGSAVMFGPPGIGKSTFILRMGIAIATGQENFLGWPIERQQKVMFTSLEMPHDELKYFLNQMNLTDEELEKLQENFFLWPIGHPYPMDVRDQQIEILKYIDRYNIKLNLIDSMGEATYGSILSQDDMKRLYSFLNEDLRKERGCGYFFVHHPRKPGGGDDKGPKTFDDAYGDSYIINRAQTVIGLFSGGPNKLKVNILKSRLSLDQQSFTIARKPDRSFERIESAPPKKEKEEGDSKLLSLGRGHDAFTK